VLAQEPRSEQSCCVKVIASAPRPQSRSMIVPAQSPRRFGGSPHWSLLPQALSTRAAAKHDPPSSPMRRSRLRSVRAITCVNTAARGWLPNRAELRLTRKSPQRITSHRLHEPIAARKTEDPVGGAAGDDRAPGDVAAQNGIPVSNAAAGLRRAIAEKGERHRLKLRITAFPGCSAVATRMHRIAATGITAAWVRF